jgi:hypothetical protein
MPLNRHWEMGPPRATKTPPPYSLHRRMDEVLDQEVLARRDAVDLARYRTNLRKTSHPVVEGNVPVAETNERD